MSEELLPYKAPKHNNRDLLEGPGLIEEEEKEGDFLRSGGGGEQMSGFKKPTQHNLSPLIEEEPEQVSKPSTSNSAKANLARYLFKTKFEGRKRWEKSMPFSQSTRRMFGADTPKEAAAKGLFQPLVGAKMSDARKKQRDEGKLAYNQGRQDRRDNAKGFWSKLWNGITRGRTAMDFFFGARRKPSKSAGALGITSTNAPHGESSGWADQLIDASKAGRLDEGSDDKPAFLSEPVPGQQEQLNQHQSVEHIVDEEKVPAPKQPEPQLLTSKDAKRNSYMNLAYTGQQVLNQRDVNNKAPDDDDLSIDESEDEEDEQTKAENARLLQQYDSDEEPSAIQQHIMGMFQKNKSQW